MESQAATFGSGLVLVASLRTFVSRRKFKMSPCEEDPCRVLSKARSSRQGKSARPPKSPAPAHGLPASRWRSRSRRTACHVSSQVEDLPAQLFQPRLKIAVLPSVVDGQSWVKEYAILSCLSRTLATLPAIQPDGEQATSGNRINLARLDTGKNDSPFLICHCCLEHGGIIPLSEKTVMLEKGIKN